MNFRQIAMTIAVAVVVATVAGCNSESDRDGGIKREVFAPKLRELIAANLKDPSSAQFRNEQFYRSVAITKDGKILPANVTLCGEINAKNSYGAYSGFHRFISTAPVTIDGKEIDMSEGRKQTFEQDIEDDSSEGRKQLFEKLSVMFCQNNEIRPKAPAQ